MVVHADIDGAVGIAAVSGVLFYHDEGGGLFSPRIAAVFFTGQYVALDRVVGSVSAPGPREAFFPVYVADLPSAATMPNWRWPGLSSFRTRTVTISSGVSPFSRSSRPRHPKEVFIKDCVATAPTPAFAQGTTCPTAKKRDATATPISFAAGSRATMEKVAT